MRLVDFGNLEYPKKMISIEPIMDFDVEDFCLYIERIKPEFVYVGFDNYGNNLPEPSIEKVEEFLSRLRGFTEVKEKPSVKKRRENAKKRT